MDKRAGRGTMASSSNKMLRITETQCLNHDLISFHILHRLPVKSLLRFKCVSKPWSNTINDPKFVASHFNHAKSNPSLVAIFKCHSLMFRFLYLLQNDGHQCNDQQDNFILDLQNTCVKSIIGSCNGFICIETDLCIVICNPCTRELLTIPKADVPNEVQDSPTFVNYGFGYDPLSNEYKIVVVFHLIVTSYCMIYTLGANDLWRDITTTSHVPVLPLLSEPYTSCGALFWKAGYSKIVSFDIHLEEFHVIPDPPDPQGIRHSLFELRGCTYICYLKLKEAKDNVGLECSLYTLKDHQCWMMKSNILICLPFKPAMPKVQVRLVVFSEQILLQWLSEDGQLTLTDLQTGWQQQKALDMKLLEPVYYLPRSAVFLTNQVDNLLPLKTFVPSGAATEVKYVSSREAMVSHSEVYTKDLPREDIVSRSERYLRHSTR